MEDAGGVDDLGSPAVEDSPPADEQRLQREKTAKWWCAAPDGKREERKEKRGKRIFLGVRANKEKRVVFFQSESVRLRIKSKQTGPYLPETHRLPEKLQKMISSGKS